MQQKHLLLIIALFCSFSSFSQKVITGRITSADEPTGVPGASVFVKGSTQYGTITDLDGNYTISVPSDTCTLIFSYMGYLTQEVKSQGKDLINIVLESSQETLDELVVTALGIKREEKALGYSVQKVKGDDIAQVKELDVVNALSGKISGVNIIQADGAIGGGGSRIVIRGESSLAGNNDPLYIINGVPGSANDVAPDDIENISVLKGPAAAALYGAKAGSGVILITSKSGKNKDGIQVSINSNVTFQSPLVLPKYQNKYGMGYSETYSYYDGNQGDDPYYDDTKYNWGPEFDGELRSQFNGKKAWVAYKDNVKDFYQTGHILINNISVANSSDRGNFRFSYTNTDQKGIMPNNGLNKNNFSLNSTFNLNEKISLSANLIFIRENCDNNKQVDVRFIPRSIDISALKTYWIPGMEGEQQWNYRRSGNNPYFELYENPTWYTENKMVANISATAEIVKGLNLIGRFSTDYTNNEYYEKHAKSTFTKNVSKDLNGYYKSGLKNTWNRNADFLVSYEKGFGSINAKISGGGAHFRKEYKNLEGSIYELTYDDIWNLNNRDGYAYTVDYISEQARNSLYTFLNLDYKGKIFLDITRRDDWSSTLYPDNNHFSYHSAVASALLSDLFEMPEVLSFWKLRGSVAQVGNDIPSPYYTIEEQYSLSTDDNGLSSLEVSDTETDPYLKPEITTGYEVGTDIRLFDNRLGLDLTYYYSMTKNQILKTEKSVTSGGQSYYTTNAGVIKSSGLEITLNATPIQVNYFKWESQINWSYDRSYVVDFNEVDSKTQQVNSHLAIEDHEGQRRGTFYGKSYERAPNGERLYSLSGDTRLTDETQLGNYNPDWMASTYNTLSYKKISLSFLLDLRWGGLIFNEIERKLNLYGLSEATLLNDREGLIPDGMVEEDDGTYRKLTLADLEEYGKTGGQTGQEYWANQMEEACPECVLVDDTYLKLREVRLSYNLPNKWASAVKMSSMTVAVVGRNLAVWSKVKHIDPETFGYATDTNDFGSQTKVPGYANSSIPSIRSYGFTVSCKF